MSGKPYGTWCPGIHGHLMHRSIHAIWEQEWKTLQGNCGLFSRNLGIRESGFTVPGQFGALVKA